MKDIAKTVTIVILFVALVVTIAARVMDSQDEKWYEKQVNNRYLYITFDDSGKHYEDTVDLYCPTNGTDKVSKPTQASKAFSLIV